MTTPVFVSTDQALATACAAWRTHHAIGLDTEFERTRTYYSRPALVQICAGRQVTLVDPLAIEDFSPLAALLGERGVVKIMHAAEGDSEVLEQLAGVVPEPVFDTQLAAAFTGHGFSIGYRGLVERLLDVRLAKDETRSDWLRRPLSDAQIAYATQDVLHLLPMHRRLRDALETLGRAGWLAEETERLRARRAAETEPGRAYLRIRQARRLDGGALAALRGLAAWRENEARVRDLPRQMVVTDDALVAIASAGPGSADALAGLGVLSGKALARHGEAVVDAVAVARGQDPPPSAPAMERRHGPWLKALKEVLRRRAAELDVPAPLLAQTRTLEQLVAEAAAGRPELPEALSGWREEAVGRELMAALRRLAGGTA